MNSDFRDLLRFLNAREVRYLIVGGYAVIFHAEPRFTQDLDIWIEPNEDNARALMKAFGDFGLPLMGGVCPSDFEVPGTQYMVGVPPCAIDFLTSVPGADFRESWARRAIVDDDGLTLNYLGKIDLISAKKAAGRPKDLMDLDNLEDL